MAAETALIILFVGIAIIAAVLIKPALARLSLPAMVGYVLMGIAVSLADARLGLLAHKAQTTVEFLAQMGLTILLFKIGLESKIHKLLRQIKMASVIGLTCIVISGVLAFSGVYWLLNMDLLTSLIVAIAMTATSVGVAAGIWEETNAIESDQGQLLLDVAEFDDITGVVLMALLFAVAPVIEAKTSTGLAGTLVQTGSIFAAKFLLFGASCLVFALYAEKPVTTFCSRFEKGPELTLIVIAMGFVIAAIAGLLGFSMAVGAFFAGLIFSRDPEAVKSRPAFRMVYDLFAPFFFIGIGLKTQAQTLAPALWPALILMVVAVAGKFFGAALPALISQSPRTSVLIGLSMVPRAEVAMIIAQRSINLGDDAMPEHIFTAIILTCMATCIFPPITLKKLIPRWTH